MQQIFLLAEGQTEERFVKSVLAPHLVGHGIHVEPIIVQTKRIASGKKYRGGIGSWGQVARDIRNLLRASHVVAVTTMIDLYGLPADWPGCEQHAADPYDKVAAAEATMLATIGDRRFLPHLMLHEFETLLFAEPDLCAQHAGLPDVASRLRDAVSKCGSPEHVNDGLQTAPSKRIENAWPGYAKTTDGPALVASIGLGRLRAACPHFAQWLSKLEALGDSN